MKNIGLFISSAQALLADYLSVYCVDLGTGAYCRFSPDSDETEGTDFFWDIQNAPEVYEEDRQSFSVSMQEDNLRGIMKNGSTKPFEFRIIIDGEPVWHTIKAAGSADMLVLGIMNTDARVRERQKAEELLKEREAFDQIADSLASNYDFIYYIDRDSSSYSGFTSRLLSHRVCHHTIPLRIRASVKYSTALTI